MLNSTTTSSAISQLQVSHVWTWLIVTNNQNQTKLSDITMTRFPNKLKTMAQAGLYQTFCKKPCFLWKHTEEKSEENGRKEKVTWGSEWVTTHYLCKYDIDWIFAIRHQHEPSAWNDMGAIEFSAHNSCMLGGAAAFSKTLNCQLIWAVFSSF